MTTTQRNNIASPTAGLVVYDTTAQALYIYNGTTWVNVNASQVAFHATKNGTNQTVTPGVYTKLTFSSVTYDTNANFANSRFTPTVAGKYLIIASAGTSSNAGGDFIAPAVFKNGVSVAVGDAIAALAGQGIYHDVSTIVDMNGTTDYVEAYATSATGTVSGGTTTTYFTGAYLGGGAGGSSSSGSASGSSGYIQFNNSGSFASDANLFWDNTGKKLGIGTTAPATLLEASKTVSSGAAAVEVVRMSAYDTRSTAARSLSFNLPIDGATSFGMSWNTIVAFNLTPSTGTPALTVLSGGNVGIGTTSPGSRLTVDGVVESTSGGIKFPDGSVQATAIAGNSVPIRQTVLSGPMSVSGLPSFLPSTSASLSLTTQNISSSATLVVTSSNGFGASGAINNIGVATANLTWSGLTANTTNYLYVTISGGNLVTGVTTLVPVYQGGGAASVMSGQFTYNIIQGVGYLGNGSSAVQSNMVFVGECVTNASSVTSTIAYAYQGYYDTGWINTLPATPSFFSVNSNLGIESTSTEILIKNLTAEIGYSPGDVVNNFGENWGTSGYGPTHKISTRNTTGLPIIVGTFMIAHKSGGTASYATSANWAYRIVTRRGW